MTDEPMKYGPDIARLASLIGDPARANMLTALMSGKALTAGELANEAGITPQTASSHLARMEDAGLLVRRKQGRHRYFALRNDSIAQMLETMMGVAANSGHLRTRTGPKDAELREARACFDHLAGSQAVELMNSLLERGALLQEGDEISLTDTGVSLFTDFGIDIDLLSKGRRPLCRSCLDWSERRFHLGGAIGAGILDTLYKQGWARREKDSRIIRFSPVGIGNFRKAMGLTRV